MSAPPPDATALGTSTQRGALAHDGRWTVHALIGLLLGVGLLWGAFHLAALRDRAFPEGPPVDPEVQWGIPADVSVSFVVTATGAPRGYRLAQGLGWQRHPIAIRAAVIEHPAGTLLFNTGVDAARLTDTLPMTVWNPFGRLSAGTSVGDALRGEDIDMVIVSSGRWYAVGGARTLDDVPIAMSFAERWAALDGPWPYRRGIATGWVDELDEPGVLGIDGPGRYGSRRSHDVFGDGTVLALTYRGAGFAEVVLRVRLGSGRELLLVSDSLWVAEGIEALAPRYAMATWRHDVDHGRLRTLQQYWRALPGVEVIPLHDGALALPEYPERWR